MLFSSRQNLIQSLGLFILALACVVGITSLQKIQLNTLQEQINNTSAESIKKQVEVERVRLKLLEKLPTFNFSNLVANWVFISFLLYFGDNPARAQTGYSLSPEYFEIILKHDPRFLDAYLFLSGSTSLYAALPERSVALMNQGLQEISPQSPPKSYYIWRYKATDELLFLGNSQAAQQSFETAAQWANTLPDPESQNVATASRQTAQFLARNPASKSAQVAAWALILSNPIDDRTRPIVINRIRALGGDVITTPDGETQIRPPQQD